MSYIGENSHFSFGDGSCEQLPHSPIGTAEAAVLGRCVSGISDIFCVGGEGFSNEHIMYALCGAIAETGRDVYICEDTDLPSFRFGLKLLSVGCGLYVHPEKSLKISFFGMNGFPLGDKALARIMLAKPQKSAEKCGVIRSFSSFRSIYVNNIAENLSGVKLPISAGISCADSSLRRLWEEFFTGRDDSLSFQISQSGLCVNAFTPQHGIVPHEKLLLAYALLLSDEGEAVWLPESVHYEADRILRENSGKLIRFSPDKPVPEEAAAQRFLADPLYMCTRLAAQRGKFLGALSKLSGISSVRRIIPLTPARDVPYGKTIAENGGRITIYRSGKNFVTLTAQSLMAETAAEICDVWCEKLRKLSMTSPHKGKSSELTGGQNY